MSENTIVFVVLRKNYIINALIEVVGVYDSFAKATEKCHELARDLPNNQYLYTKPVRMNSDAI